MSAGDAFEQSLRPAIVFGNTALVAIMVFRSKLTVKGVENGHWVFPGIQGQRRRSSASKRIDCRPWMKSSTSARLALHDDDGVLSADARAREQEPISKVTALSKE